MIKVLMSSTTPIMKDGITNVMLNLYKKINRSEFQVDFIVGNKPDEDINKLILENGGRYTIIPRSKKHIFRYIKEYARICKGYDIVHVHGNSATIFFELFAAFLAGVKIRIAHSHNTYCTAKKADKILRIPFHVLCNGRFACSQAAGEWLFGKRKFIIINNGINTEKFIFSDEARNKIRAKLNLNNKKVIGHVGNFLPVKNHAFIIDVFEELAKIDDSYCLVLLGTGATQENIKQQVKKLKLEDRVHFVGSVSNVEDYLSAMDVIIMPSIHEGLPLTLIEEQANGLKCVISDAITKEVDLSGNVEFISLNSSVQKWVTTIEKKLLSSNRYDDSIKAIKIIKELGYDIGVAADKLQNYYKTISQ